jgi:3-hydroxyacyl-CoA dehydrogenase
LRDKTVSHPKRDAFLLFARSAVGAMSKNYPAPLRCVDAVEAALTKPFDEGLAVERKLFAELYAGPEACALRHLFFAERQAAKVEGVARDVRQRDIASVAVLGAGTMGSGIAICFLLAGIPTTILEANQGALDSGLGRIRGFFESRVRKGVMTAEKAAATSALLRPTLSYDDLAQVDLVIEAVFEEMGVKRTVFETLDRVCKRGAILASNTSTLDLNTIASFTQRPQDVIGMHFFSPANVMKLLEVVRGARTGDDVLMSVLRLAKVIRKTAVVAGVCDGFIGNRMIAGYSREALNLLEEGATVAQVDGALEKFGMAMGPFRMNDLAGNDIGWAIRKRLRAQGPAKKWPTATNLADRLCELGRFGQKVGAGWYRYDKDAGSREPIPDPEIDSLVETHRTTLGISRRRITDDEIVKRCIFALVNEGARIVAEGIAQRASDIDVVYIYGYGFPPWRGGPMHYANEVGLIPVRRAMEEFARSRGADDGSWEVAPLLARLADEGKVFV